jgi:hypothetical protein
MAHTSCMLNMATRTHAHPEKHVIFIAFPWQQWFANTPECYIIRTLPVLLSIVTFVFSHLSPTSTSPRYLAQARVTTLILQSTLVWRETRWLTGGKEVKWYEERGSSREGMRVTYFRCIGIFCLHGTHWRNDCCVLILYSLSHTLRHRSCDVTPCRPVKLTTFRRKTVASSSPTSSHSSEQ